MENKRGNFTGNLGFVLAAAGAAVGLGNIWKFPYLAGMSGGGLFIIIYLVLLVIMGVPLMLAETSIGRRGQGDAKTSTVRIATEMNKPNPGKWGAVGMMGVVCAFIIYTYYPVVGGWILDFMVKSVTVPLAEITGDTFGTVVSNWPMSILFSLIFYAACFIIVIRGISGGVEKASKIMMPALFVILIVIVIRSVTLPGAGEGLKFLWQPNMETVREAGGFWRVALAALGQLFFSLSLGQGIMITYGSYLKKDTNLLRNSVTVPLMDSAVAILAGMAIMPAVFAFGMEPNQGTGLIFATLPQVFNNFGAFLGPVFMFLFFVLVLFAALTSAISLLEVISTFMIDTFKWDRKKAVTVMSIIGFALGVVNILSMSVFADFQIGGQVLFDALGWLADKIIIPLCSLAVCIFVGHVWGVKDARKEITNEGALQFKLFGVWSILIKYVAPILIVIIMVAGLLGL